MANVRGNAVNWRHPLNRGLVGWWLGLPSGAGGGTMRDIAGRAGHGTLTNGPTWAPGPVGLLAVKAVGGATGDCVGSMSAVPWWSDARVTVAAWVRFEDWLFPELNDASYASCIVFTSREPSSARSPLLYPSRCFGGGGNRLVFCHSSDGTLTGVRGDTQFSLNTWYHVAGTYDGTTWKVYVNGLDDGNTSVYLGGAAHSTYSGTVSFGRDLGWDPSKSSAQTLAEVRLYDRPLPASEVLGLYLDGLRRYPETLNRREKHLPGVTVTSPPPATTPLLTLLGVG